MTDLLSRDVTETRSKRRRRRTVRRAFGRVLVILFASALTVSAVVLTRFDGARTPPPAPGAAVEQTALLLAMNLQDDPSGQADSFTAFVAGGPSPAAMFMPAGTLAPIPGQGFEAIGKSLAFGRAGLAELTVENMLGVNFDSSLVFDDLTLAKIVDAVGGIDIDVTESLLERGKDGVSESVFTLGPQKMDGPNASVYMTYLGEKETELDRFPRMQKVWEGIVSRLRAGASVDAALEVIDGPLVEPAAVAAFGRVLRAMAATPAAKVSFDVLPSTPIGAGDDRDGYDIDDQVAAIRVERLFVGSLAATDIAGRPRVEIRNGNGRPEAGEEVAALLIPDGLRLAVNGNAGRFDHEATKVLVYSTSEESMTLARRVRDLLGQGTIEVATRGQTVVDVTVVIGKDFTAS